MLIARKFCFLSILLINFFASTYAEDFMFNEQYQSQILFHKRERSSPDSDSYRSFSNTFLLDNGLCAVSIIFSKSHFFEDTFSYNPYSGPVNIIHQQSDFFGKNFKIILKDKKSSYDVILFYDDRLNDKGLHTIRSVTENEIKKAGFFSTKYHYQYVIEVDNESRWVTEVKNKRWENPWIEGSHVLLIGTNQKPCLVNVNTLDIGSSNLQGPILPKDFQANLEHL